MQFLISNLKLLMRKFPSVLLINIAGLSVAFAVTLVVVKQVWYDLRYDRAYENSGKIFFCELDWGSGGGPMPYMNQQIPELWMERVPEMESYCLLNNQGIFSFGRDGAQSGGTMLNNVSLSKASAGFLDVFTPKIVAGDASATFLVPGHCIISEKTAAAIFGNEDPIGKVIVSGMGEKFIVDAVYIDYPKNSSIGSGVYTYQEPLEPYWHRSRGYFLFPPADRDRILERINDPALLAEDENGRYTEEKYYFTELSQFYLHGGAAGEGGSFRIVVYLSVIGLFVLVVAIINFINLSMAMAPSRVRNVNIHRILGIKKGNLRVSLAMESLVVSLAAVVVGGVIVHWFAASTFTDFFTAPLALVEGIPLTAAVILLFLVVAFGVGLYSARYASTFEVAIALKSSFALSRQGTRLRSTLIVVQFATAIFFICFSAAVAMQYNYMSAYSVGYEKENIVTFDGGMTDVAAEALAGELKRNPYITDVTSSYDLPGNIGSLSGTNIKDKPVSYHTWTVADNFLDFFGIEATEGRVDAGFRLYIDEGFFASTMIANRELLRKYEFTEQEMAQIGIGVAEDVNFQSLREPVKPMAFTILPEWTKVYPKVFVKITGNNVPATMEYIQNTWNALSGQTGDVGLTFLDEHLDRLYKRELNMSRLIGILGLVAVVIAIMGVYGLAAFNTRYKTREIAIRKVSGATIGDIALLLNRGMLYLVGAAFVIVVPLTVWMVQKWISTFAFSTSIPWWLYLAAGVAVLFVSVATVSWQSWKAASTNPVKALKSE